MRNFIRRWFSAFEITEFRCQAIKGVDEAKDEYIICGAKAPRYVTNGPIEAHLCHAHYAVFDTSAEVKIALGEIGRHGIVWKP